MTIDEYFNEIQEFIKTKIEQPNELDLIIKELDKDNIQAVVNQDYNDNVSIEDCAEKLLKATEVKGGIDVTEAPVLDGDRALNTMERKVLSYKDFLNENKKDDKGKNKKDDQSQGKSKKVVKDVFLPNEILCRSCAAYGGCKLEKKGSATKCRNYWQHLDFSKY